MNRINLTDRFVGTVKSDPVRRILYHDEKCRGLAIAVEPLTKDGNPGGVSYKCRYTFSNRTRTYNMGPVRTFANVQAARNYCFGLLGKVRGNDDRKGIDPQADRIADRQGSTFSDHVAQYLSFKADDTPKSLKQIAGYLNPLAKTWAKLPSADIPRSEFKALLARTSKKSPAGANNQLAALSGLYTWLIDMDLIKTAHPLAGIKRNKLTARERVMDDAEVRKFWCALSGMGGVEANVLRALLLTGQRSKEVRFMRREHIKPKTLKLPDHVRARLKAIGQIVPAEVSGFLWEMPGKPSDDWNFAKKTGTWPGTKGATTHTVWLPPSLADLIGPERDGFVFADDKGKPISDQNLPKAMKKISAAMELAKNNFVKAHDLRRTHGTTITGLGFSRDAMNRIQNHADGGIASVYDRTEYLPEFWEIMSAAIQHLTALEAPVADAALRGVS